MKKFFGILVLFSILSIGNIEKIEAQSLNDCTNCFCEYHTVYNGAIAAGQDEHTAFALATGAFNDCINRDN